VCSCWRFSALVRNGVSYEPLISVMVEGLFMQRRGGERVPDFQLLRSEALFILRFLVPSACYGSG